MKTGNTRRKITILIKSIQMKVIKITIKTNTRKKRITINVIILLARESIQDQILQELIP